MRDQHTAYVIVDRKFYTEVEEAVNELLEDGYEPQGGVSAHTGVDGLPHYAQAVYKPGNRIASIPEE